MAKSKLEVFRWALVGIVGLLWLTIGHGLAMPIFCGTDSAKLPGTVGCTAEELSGGTYDAVGWECVFDPGCASPFYRVNRHPDDSGTVPEWTGAQFIPDYVAPNNVFRLFSPLSWALLVSLTVLPATLLQSFARSSHLSRSIGLALYIWYDLKLVGWIVVFNAISGSYGDSIVYTDWATWLVIGLAAGPVFLATIAERKNTPRARQQQPMGSNSSAAIR